MKKYLVTFLNYNNDYNTDEDRERLALFKKYITYFDQYDAVTEFLQDLRK